MVSRYDLLNELSVSDLKEIVRRKKIEIRPGFWSGKIRKENYVSQLEGYVTVDYLKRFKIERAAKPGKKHYTLQAVKSAISRWKPPSTHFSERGYENDFVGWALKRFGEKAVINQYSVGRTRIDVVIGGIGVELKRPTSPRQLMTLRGQIEVYQKHFKKKLIILLFSGACDQHTISEFKRDIKKKGIAVIEKKM